MDPAVDRLAAALADVAMASPRIPVVSNVDARSHDDPEEIRELIARIAKENTWGSKLLKYFISLVKLIKSGNFTR